MSRSDGSLLSQHAGIDAEVLVSLDLDIRAARIQTLGTSVVDAYYVRDASGHKVTDTQFLAEVEKAILHAVET